MTAHRFVIVGGGLAGATAAKAARGAGFDGSIVLLSAEGDLPYRRPALSKSFLRGDERRGAVLAQPPGWYEEHDVELRLQSPAAVLDRVAPCVRLEDGSEVPYDDVLLATGAAPQPLHVAGDDLGGIHVLHTLREAEALRADLSHASRAVVIGASWVGLEAAASARRLGLDVLLVDPQPQPLADALGEAVGSLLADLHALNGVDLRLLGTRVDGFIEGASGRVVALQADGEHVDCDAVIVSPPSVPRVGLAAAAGVRVDDGVLVDARLRSSDPHVLAAGDVAQVYVHGVGRMRIPHAPAAVEQGTVAGRSLVRTDALLDPLPVVTSEQYDVVLELYGHPSPLDEVLLRGDPGDGRFCAFWIRSELVTAALSVDVRGVGEALERIVRSGTLVDRRRLADPGRPLGELAPPWPVTRQSSLADTA